MTDFYSDLQQIQSFDFVHNQPFKALSIVADYFNSDRHVEGRELLFHLMDQGPLPENVRPILSALLETAGLYPYVSSDEVMSSSDQIVYEAHRPEGSLNTILHEAQFDAYVHLMDGENVVLSAPTSFGKSMLIDVLIGTGRYHNVVVIVPTIALIDETRRRLIRKFGIAYKVITHPTQQAGAENIYVLTQERYLEMSLSVKPDLFVIDEFYKLSPTCDGEYDDRTLSLNLACLKLIREDVQFLLIGPNIQGVDVGSTKIKYRFIKSDFRTVGTSERTVKIRGGKERTALEICLACSQQTLLFCSSINRVYSLASYLVDNGLSAPSERAKEFAGWLARNYSSEWSLVRFVQNGVAVHHSSLPRSVSQYLLQMFNEGAIRYLLCTSTIIEGVNTSAKNIIVYDNKIAKRPFDYFTFNNIKGRAGRMFKHLVGKVYVLESPPQPELPLVTIPALSLPEGIPLSLAIEAGSDAVEKLSQPELNKLRYLHAQDYLPVEIVKKNAPYDVMAQIEIAKYLHENSDRMHAKMAWSGVPSSAQEGCLLELVFDKLLKGDKRNGVLSAPQLKFMLGLVQSYLPKGVSIYLAEVIKRKKSDVTVDRAIRDAFGFLRNWGEFQLPRAITAIDRIQKFVFESHQMSSGDYGEFGERVKHLFLPPAESILEEYGMPIPITSKIGHVVKLPETIDELLDFMPRVDPAIFSLEHIEREMFDAAFANYGNDACL